MTRMITLSTCLAFTGLATWLGWGFAQAALYTGQWVPAFYGAAVVLLFFIPVVTLLAAMRGEM